MHSFFDSFVNNGTTLREYVIKYEKALECRYLDEQEEQFASKYKFPTKVKSPLEFQDELNEGTLHKRDVEEIPAHFILPRWTKEVIYDMDISLPSKVGELPLILRNMVFYRMVNHLSTYLGASEETYHLIVGSVEEIYKKVVTIEGPIGVKNVEAPRHQEQTEHAPLQDPAISQTKGRKKDSANVSRKGRIMSGVEASMKRRRKCSICKQFDHDARTCEQNQECKYYLQVED
ncbi:hypothetical protein LUZ63_010607 [Rhynchospora breviuscula]|uniref:Protein FAR1-RELATED SEQUENCE n=1 Tax=Rhynchospora breviuscula TaxID=2022672 RepID=A0A9Q0CH59_9POAL|nr:hypothetical protein LUZ63_010607 [Rhynchospora breviuscula]